MLLWVAILQAQSEKNTCNTLTKMSNLIKELHYAPKPINDSLSVYVFTSFLDNLDPNNDLFLASEIESLKKHKYKIDDYINNSHCEFLNVFFQTYNDAIDRHIKLVSEIKNEPFPLSSPEIIRFYAKKRPYLKTKAELKKIFKKRMLMDIFFDISKISTKKDSLVSELSSLIPVSRQKIFDEYTCESGKYTLTKDEFYDRFFSIFSNYFDPHTQYFSKNAKTNFLTTVSADNYTFGLFLSYNENNQILVSGTLPGTSTYFLEKIEPGDIITKIKSSDEEYLANCINIEKIENIFNSSEYKKAYFTFQKKNGEIYGLTLVKQIMKDYHNSAYSYIVERDNQKTGYINIPSFYSTMEDGKTNVSEDVAKEIYKLKEDNISGLIIDLEDNGGGSMNEAIKLCSLFIKGAPIGQVENKSHQKEKINSLNGKVIFSGPIIILQNGNSASASEFFANAMQDYRLALLVGTKSFGKASFQEILPLDDQETQFIKLTVGKFYRITGKSNQSISTIPDIVIPNIFDEQIQREINSKTALKNEKIGSIVSVETFPFNEKQKLAIKTYTNKYKTDPETNKIKALGIKMNNLLNNPFEPLELKFSSVYDRIFNLAKSWIEFEEQTKKEYNFLIYKTSYDRDKLKLDSYLKTISDKQIKILKSNYRIYEAIKIMADLK